MRRRTRSTAPHHRLGFTLIELLVVIVILAILIGLLVPAVMQAVGSAKDAAVAAEIRAMSQALADFKTKYGEYPPSRILISEGGDYSSATITSAAAAALVPRSTSYLRRFWPRMQLNTSGTAGNAPGIDTTTNGKFYDVNGNGTADGVYILTGPECLVLFLGGVPQLANGGANWSVTGFSKNPVNPFQNNVVTTNRTVPLFEFNNSRLVSNLLNSTTSSSGSFPGYLDSIGATGDSATIPFYVYFSAYNGTGYDPGDADFPEASTDESISPIMGAFTSNNAPTSTKYSGGGGIILSPAPNPYTNDVPVATVAGTGAVDVANNRSHAWQNAQSFQIVSPGRDRRYGIGGQYVASGNDRLPFVKAAAGYVKNSLQTQQANATVTGQALGPDTRSVERDNITNFSAGKLD